MAKKFQVNRKRVAETSQYDQTYDTESERGKVILGAARLDDLLRVLISRNIINGNDIESDELFDGTNAILQSFGAKISIAYRFGMISENEHNSLKIIKDIRNKFAHNLHDISFNHEWIRKQCSSFQFPAVFALSPSDTSFVLFQSALYKLDLELQHRIEQFAKPTVPKDISWDVFGSSLSIIE